MAPAPRARAQGPVTSVSGGGERLVSNAAPFTELDSPPEFNAQ